MNIFYSEKVILISTLDTTLISYLCPDNLNYHMVLNIFLACKEILSFLIFCIIILFIINNYIVSRSNFNDFPQMDPKDNFVN